jgi:hypothetical protein
VKFANSTGYFLEPELDTTRTDSKFGAPASATDWPGVTTKSTLYFSYETCGDIDDFSNEGIVDGADDEEGGMLDHEHCRLNCTAGRWNKQYGQDNSEYDEWEWVFPENSAVRSGITHKYHNFMLYPEVYSNLTGTRCYMEPAYDWTVVIIICCVGAVILCAVGGVVAKKVSGAAEAVAAAVDAVQEGGGPADMVAAAQEAVEEEWPKDAEEAAEEKPEEEEPPADE